MDNQQYDFPKTVAVGGRTYQIDPRMPVTELREVQASLQNEMRKMVMLKAAMGEELDEEEMKLLGIDPDEEHR